MKLSESVVNKINEMRPRYPDAQAMLLPALHIAQAEFGYISSEVEESLAIMLGLPVTKVHAVSTFYTMYNHRQPGQFHIQVCTNVSCSLLGADHIFEYLAKKLGIGAGETTGDGMFTLSRVECLGACGMAPVMQINDDYYENLTEGIIDTILEDLRENG